MTNSLNTNFGKVSYPLDSSQVSYTGRVVADPALTTLATFLRDVLLADVGAAFDAAKVGTTVDGYVVEDIIPFDPGKYLALNTTNKFPLLAVYRDRAKFDEHTLMKIKRAQTWGIVYILPELDPVAMGKLHPMLNAIGDILGQAIFTQYHPAALDGYNMWDACGFSRAWVDDIQDAFYEGVNPQAGDTMVTYPAIKLTLVTWEIAKDFPVTTTLQGVDASYNLKDVSTETSIPDFIQTDASTT